MKIIDSGEASAVANMEMDTALLKGLAVNQEPIIHFYEWKKPSATYGYFQKPHLYLRNDIDIELARRPTGGGIIFHDTDFAFSLLIPATHRLFSVNTLNNYLSVHKSISKALLIFDHEISTSLLNIEPACSNTTCHNFCMAKPTQYDIMVNGKKIVGGAQRRTRHGFLHQGSICLTLPDEGRLKSFFHDGINTWEHIPANSHPLLKSNDGSAKAKERLKEIIVNIWWKELREGY